MPLIIKEMAIKVSVQDSGGKEAKGKEPEKAGGGQGGAGGDMVAIVVEKVMEILKEKTEP